MGVVLSGGWDEINVNLEGYQPREGEDMAPYSNIVSPDYFGTMRIPMVAGRDFNEHDNLKSGSVGIINQTMARYFFGNRNPIGKKFGTDPGRPHFYVPVAQQPRLFDMTLHLRTNGDARPVVSLLRKTLQKIDPNVPLYNVSTLEIQLDDSLARDRLITWLSTAFGVLATLLATMGLYGVIAFSVAQRTREIGIRMALGAQRFDVLRLVLQQVTFLVLGGLALGTFISLGGIRAVGTLLYGIEATDPFAFLGAAAVLLVAAALAAFSPARRATHVNPTVALRYE
jgi:hypothetical protein